MVPQKYKDFYYQWFYLASLILKPFYKIHYSVLKNSIKKVQVGSGENYLKDFINIDGNFQRKVDYLLDVRVGLPFPKHSIDFIYSCHMLEHVYIEEAISILKEFHFCLNDGGIVRLTLPDYNHVKKIISGESSTSFPRHFHSREGMAINFLFCDGQHKYAYTSEVINELALEIGFSKTTQAPNNIDENIGPLDEPRGSFSLYLIK
jgi:predicted SAM-dependent methyltransferase